MVSANPFDACCIEYETFFLAYDQLYNYSQEDLSPVSGLAYYPPEVSADKKTWTFKVREGVKWSDGVPFTAKDIAFTYNFIFKKDLSQFMMYLGSPASFEAPDDTTFVWKMEKPTLSPLAPPWIPILPEHIWSKFWNRDNAEIKQFRNVPAVGTGPFVLDEWQESRFWRMTANPYYWGTKPAIDEIIFRVFQSPEAQKLALQAGEVDFVDSLTPTVLNSLNSAPNVTTHVASPIYIDNLAFNFEGTGHPALRDEQVRLAIAHAINKQAILDRVLLGKGVKGDSFIMPVYGKYYRQFNGTPDEIRYDPQEAERILDEAGYIDTDGDGVREMPNGGEPLKMQVTAIGAAGSRQGAAELIAGYLNDVGFDVGFKVVSAAQGTTLWSNQDFDMYIWGWGGDPDPDFILSTFTSDQCLWWSDGCYKDPVYDKMYEQQHFEIDEAKRIELVKQMEKYIYEHNPELALFYESDLQAWRTDTFEGYVFQPAPDGSALFSFGPYSYLNLKPVSRGNGEAAGTSSEKGAAIPPIVWIGLAAVIVLWVAVSVARRRGKHGQETE